MFRRTGILLLALMLACTACGKDSVQQEQKEEIRQGQPSIPRSETEAEREARKKRTEEAKKKEEEAKKKAEEEQRAEEERKKQSLVFEERYLSELEETADTGSRRLRLQFPRGEEYDHAFERGDARMYSYYVDRKGERVLPENFVLPYSGAQGSKFYNTVGFFSEGLFAAMDLEKDRKIGFFDEEGDPVIPTIFDDVAFHFLEGVVPVLKDNRWGILKNPLSIQEQYEKEKKYFKESELEIIWLEGFDWTYSFKGFSEGLAAFTKETAHNEQGFPVGVIDKEGKIRIPLGGPDGNLRSSSPNRYSPYPAFCNGCATFFRLGEHYEYERAVIDKEGNYIQEWRKIR